MKDRAADTISLLDIIRQEEEEATKRLAAAREAAAKEIALAKQNGKEIVIQAELEGQKEGHVLKQEIMEEVEHEVELIIDQAHVEAGAFEHVTKNQMEKAIAHAVAIVIGDRSNEFQSLRKKPS